MRIWFALFTEGFTHASSVKVVPEEISNGDSKFEDRNCDPESEIAVSVSVVVATLGLTLIVPLAPESVSPFSPYSITY